MSIAFSSIAAAAVGFPVGSEVTTVRVPPKRRKIASADPKLSPEAR